MGEACDDGNATCGDGCDPNCKASGCVNGYFCVATEQCDDGNGTNGDGCDNNCTPTGCNNGIATAGEQCDDGNAACTDGCDPNCKSSGCMNGYVCAPVGEQCDDGNANTNDACRNDCGKNVCGDGTLCSDAATCGVVAGTKLEQCDDAGINGNGDKCLNNCNVALCGDGAQMVSTNCSSANACPGARPIAENCDDGNTTDWDTCPSGSFAAARGVDCLVGNYCGDAFAKLQDTYTGCGGGVCWPVGTAPLEQCDNGIVEISLGFNTCRDNPTQTCVVDQDCPSGDLCANANVSDHCRTSCTLPRCGDNTRDLLAEGCDDGSASCVSPVPSVNNTECGTASGKQNCDDHFGTCQKSGEVISRPGEANVDWLANACKVNCALGFCSDGVLDDWDEQCDDGNASNSDSCLTTCVLASCGDGYVQAGVEECDNGAASNGTSRVCKGDCAANVCGDGARLDEGPNAEQCDDGNTNDLDGCSGICCGEAASVDSLTTGGLIASYTCNLNNRFVSETSDAASAAGRRGKSLAKYLQRVVDVSDDLGAQVDCRQLKRASKSLGRIAKKLLKLEAGAGAARASDLQVMLNAIGARKGCRM
jgi:cysteine-rich repeat protein